MEEEEDQLAEMPSQTVFTPNHSASRIVPMTAAVDGPSNRFTQHQQMGQRGMNPNSIPFTPVSFNSNMMAQQSTVQNQALQMQILQLEMMRMQVSFESQLANDFLPHDLST